jgi:hypothetical protein
MDDDRRNFFPDDVFRNNGKNIVIIHNYNDVGVVNQGNNNQIGNTMDDPMELLLLKYFRNLSDDARKLKVITLVEEMIHGKK